MSKELLTGLDVSPIEDLKMPYEEIKERRDSLNSTQSLMTKSPSPEKHIAQGDD